VAEPNGDSEREREREIHIENREREREQRDTERVRGRARDSQSYGERGIRRGRVQRGIDCVGEEEERVVVAGEDTGPRRALHFASHVAALRDSCQASRKGGR
jgi:hypothetical protein